MKSQSNDAENPLWCNYTVKCQSWIGSAYCHLNSLLALIILIPEETLDVF